MQFKITGSYMDQNRSLVFNLNTAKRTPFHSVLHQWAETLLYVSVLNFGYFIFLIPETFFLL